MARKIKKKNTCPECGKYFPKYSMVVISGLRIRGKRVKVCKTCIKLDEIYGEEADKLEEQYKKEGKW